jgi:hypothetical protein
LVTKTVLVKPVGVEERKKHMPKYQIDAIEKQIVVTTYEVTAESEEIARDMVKNKTVDTNGNEQSFKVDSELVGFVANERQDQTHQICQCGSCDQIFVLNEETNCCPYCSSGNWVFGYIY